MHRPSEPDRPAESDAVVLDKQIDDSVEARFLASVPLSHGVLGASASTDAWARTNRQQIELWRVVHGRDVDGSFRRPCSKPGRWSNELTPVLYAADSSATAILEYLAHLKVDPPPPLFLVRGTVPGELTRVASDLPSTWRSTEYKSEVQAIGDAWAQSGSSLVLEVPSAVCPGAHNYLVNAMHEDARRIVIDAPIRFELDRRLVRTRERDRYWTMGAP